MKLNEYKKLELSLQEQDFNKSYKNINQVMFFLSIFGHLASIFLAYFLVSKVLSGAITDNIILVTIASIILLGGLELLKREIFDKFSLQQIKNKNFTNKDVLPLFLASFLIVSVSFYASITGAKEFSNKTNQIESEIKNTIDNFEDSLTIVYASKLSQIDSEIVVKKNKIDAKDLEQTSIESNTDITRLQRSRVQDLKKEKAELKIEISDLEQKVKEINLEFKKEVDLHKDQLVTQGETKKNENQNNSFLFVVISILIEFIILAGVYFNEYYKWRSYDDFKKKLDKDPNFQKWFNYNAVLDVIYNDDTNINAKLPSGKNIQDLCKVNGTILLNKDITEMFKIFASLGIIKTSGSVKYISKTKDVAQDLLKRHFNID